MAVAEAPQRMSLAKRIAGLLILMSMIVATALTLLYSFGLQTVFDGDLSSSFPANLPAAATSAFNGIVNGQLTAFNFEIVLVIFLAIGGGIAAVFGLGSPDQLQDQDDSSF